MEFREQHKADSEQTQRYAEEANRRAEQRHIDLLNALANLRSTAISFAGQPNGGSCEDYLNFDQEPLSLVY